MERVIVITGGAKGIGRCMVEYFASKGDKVYFIDNDAKTTIFVVRMGCARFCWRHSRQANADRLCI